MNRILPTLVSVLTAVAVSLGCGNDCGDDSVSIHQVYAETGLSVADTVDARTAFEAFVQAVKDSGEMLPMDRPRGLTSVPRGFPGQMSSFG